MPIGTLIYNPTAGPLNVMVTIEKVADFWRERGWQMHVEPTRYAGHAVELARFAAAAGQEMVIAAGGDGTLGEVANGLAHSETTLALLPAGTGNSFAKELKMPRAQPFNRNHLLRDCELLWRGRVQQMDLGCQGSRFWVLWAGAGADGYLVKQIEPRSRLSKKLGPVGYMLQILRLIPKLPPIQATIHVDNHRYQDTFLLITISNCRLFAGGELVLSPQATLDDGQFEVWLFPGHGLASILRYLWQIRLGTHTHNPDIRQLTGQQISIESNSPLYYHTDGDLGGTTPMHTTIHPRALRVLIPDSAPGDLFQQTGLPLPQ
ncbi:MAG: diacylglycerol kinase family lipid kinase [Anaerolineae bacterium]|nr:diacylglycerol kinase family lipid kinase [Anaerolineae bacterium]